MRAALFEAVRAIESEARLSWSRWRLAQKFRRLAEKEQG